MSCKFFQYITLLKNGVWKEKGKPLMADHVFILIDWNKYILSLIL